MVFRMHRFISSAALMSIKIGRATADFVPTNGDGKATFQFVPSDYGGIPGSTVYFKAVFHGIGEDNKYESYYGYQPSESEVQPLELGPSAVVPEYALGGLFALVACFAGFETFKQIKKNKS